MNEMETCYQRLVQMARKGNRVPRLETATSRQARRRSYVEGIPPEVKQTGNKTPITFTLHLRLYSSRTQLNFESIIGDSRTHGLTHILPTAMRIYSL